MKTFEIGKAYSMRSACDHECVWTYKVIARTASTLTITDGKETKTCRINKKYSEYRNAETIFPLGKYSMAPTLSADKEVI
jgi:hypothetical protein